MPASTVRVFLFLSFLTSVETAGAQTKIFLLTGGGSGCPNPCGRLSAIDPDLPAILSTAAIPTSGGIGHEGTGTGGEYVTPDGALVVWFNPSVFGSGQPPMLGMFNVSTRSTVTIPLPAATQAFIGHPRRAELFLTDAQGPVALSFAGARRLSGPACAGPESIPVSISADGSRVIYTCQLIVSGPAFIVDTDSGATVATTTVNGPAPALSPDGQSMYRIEFGTPAQLRKYAVSNGALLAEAPLSSPLPGVVRVDPRTGRVFVIDRTAQVFEGTSLTPVTAGVLPWFHEMTPQLSNLTWTFDPERPLAYVSASRLEEPSGPFPSGGPIFSYYVLDTESLLPVISVPNAALHLDGAKFVVAPRPAAPLELTASVQQGSVQLTWSAGVSNATTLGHVVEAGSGPGLANLAILNAGPQTSLTVNGVPSGTYHVRVRAANVTGTGPASNEIIVTVP